MGVSSDKQVAQPYTQTSAGAHASVYLVDGVASTSHAITTGSTAKTITFGLSTNYTFNASEDTTIEIAISNGMPNDTVTITPATASSPLITADTPLNFYFTAGTKLSVRSAIAGVLTLMPSVE